MSYEHRRDDPSFLVGNLYRLQNSFDFFPLVEMEDERIVHSSDCDEEEYEEFNLLTVVNEHSEVLGLIEDSRARELPNSNIDDRGDRESDLLNSNIDDSDTELPNSNNIDNPDSGDNVDENDSDGEQDHQHYIVPQDENDDDNNYIENNVTLPQVPLVNFNGDVEHEEDFGNGWEWTETDPGSSCGPFIGQPGLLIQPASRTPEGFFKPSIRSECVDSACSADKHLCETTDTTIMWYSIFIYVLQMSSELYSYSPILPSIFEPSSFFLYPFKIFLL